MSYDEKATSRNSGAPVEAYRFARGTTLFYYTSSDTVIQIPAEGSADFSPSDISRGAIQYSNENSSGDVEITMDRLNPLAQEFIAYSPVVPVTVIIYQIHRGDADAIVAFSGIVASASFEGSEAKLKCTALANAFKRVIPTIYYQRQCNWVLYSENCGVNKDEEPTPGTFLYRTDAASVTVAGATISAAAFDARPDGFFKNGYVENDDGQLRYVTDHVGPLLTLSSPFFGAVGAVKAYAGCDRLEATCLSKFSNSIRFMGFPRIPSKSIYTKGIT